MVFSITIKSLMNTIHGLKLSFGFNESEECIETLKNGSKIKCDVWFKSNPFTFPAHQQLLLETCMFVSAICLIMHLTVYSFVPKLHNTPGKCLMSLSLSLLLVAISYLITFHIEVSPNSITCIAVALIRLYSFLSSFCWMNVMAFDVYKTFANHTSSLNVKRFNNSNSSFLIYSSYAWLLPVIILTISLIVQASVPFDSPYSPAYGKTICCISHFPAFIIFFTLPLSIILALNVMLFLITVQEIKLIRDETQFVTKSKANNRLLLNIKLVLVLGVTWIFGLLAMFINVSVIRYPAIILYGSHGTFIFIAFTVKKNVYRMIISRIKYLRRGRVIKVAVPKRRNTDDSTTSSTNSDTFLYLSGDSFRDRCCSF